VLKLIPGLDNLCISISSLQIRYVIRNFTQHIASPHSRYAAAVQIIHATSTWPSSVLDSILIDFHDGSTRQINKTTNVTDTASEARSVQGSIATLEFSLVIRDIQEYHWWGATCITRPKTRTHGELDPPRENCEIYSETNYKFHDSHSSTTLGDLGVRLWPWQWFCYGKSDC